MEAPWNLCNPLPAAEPVLMDSLEASPRSASHIKGEVAHFAAQRRSSAPFENPYARQQPQYSVQGSTSTPNSVGPSSGSVSPDGSTQQTDSNGVLIEWMKPTDDNEGYDITYAQASDVKPRYCYVVHGQHPATLPRNDSFNPSILPPNCTPSTAPRPVHLVFGMSPSTSLHFSPPSTQRSTSVPRQIGDHSHPAVVKINTSTAPKATKRKSSQEPNRPPKKPAVPRDSAPKQAPKSGISALTRRRLRIAQRPGETMPRARLPLTELTVEDLKTLCRKRNFPISGTKADLYKRLQPIEDQLDIEAMLLEAIEEEDLRMAEANAGGDEAGVKSTCSEATATAYTVATALLPQEQRRPSSQSGVNQFDVAISDYLMQHQKQLNQQRSSQRPISIENTCTWTTSSSCSIGKLAEKPPLTHIQPLVRLVPRKPNEAEEGKQNGSTFHYAEMGSGGQFTLEPTAKNVSSTTIRSGNVVKFIADPTIFRPPPVAAPPKRPVEACCEKCTERQTHTTTDGNTEELHKLIKELAVSPANASTDNPSLTAKILALHERVLGVQTTKLRAMATAIAESQKTLQCQQRLIKDVRREAKKVHSEQPSPLESLVRTVDVLELEKQHAKQTDELRKLQQSHQRMKNEQEALGRSEMELQEEIHVEQAVEDVARLIRTNRRTALLIVQLVHKFQCDRMRELDQSQSAAPLRRVPAAANAAAISQEKKCSSATCPPNVACGCARRPPPRSADPAVVVIDESDEEETPIEKTSPQATPKAVETPAAKRKTKTKTAAKKSPKIAVQRSEHTFSKIMEDIFQTVISERDEQEAAAMDPFDLNDNSTANHTPVVVEMPKEEDDDEHSKKNEIELSYAYSSKPVDTPELEIIPASYPPINGLRRPPMQIEALPVHQDHSPFAFNNNTQLMVQKIDEQMMNACAEMEQQTAAVDYHNRLADAEVRAVGTNSYYHRRALLQQKRQTLCEQLEQIELQQRRHELQNPFGSTCEMNVGEDELGCGLGDLNVDELYNCDFEQYEMSGTESSLHTPVPMSTEVTTKMDTSFTSAFHSMPMQMSAHSADVYKQHPHHPPPSYYSPHTFPHMHSNDFEDILDLIHNGDNKWDGEPTGHVETITSEQQPTTSDSECVQATNAIYQDLRQTDNQFQLFTPMPELDGMTWNDSMVVETPKTAVYGECGL